jgi:hypothetical protein
VFALLLAVACAQGGGGTEGDGGGTPGRDGGVRRDGGGGGNRDGGRDAGATCDDDAFGSSCETATDLGMVMPGDMNVPEMGVLPMMGDEDWFHVAFPPLSDPNMQGGGMPAVELVGAEETNFRIEIRGTCAATLGCGEGVGGARDIFFWSFVDDQAMEGEAAYTTRDVPWPDEVFIRVYRALGAGDCQRYQLRVTR